MAEVHFIIRKLQTFYFLSNSFFAWLHWEKPKLSYFVNTGMYILNPELKKEIPEDTFYHMTDLTNKLLKENRKVGMYPISEDSFLDMGEFEEMHRMEKKLDLKSE